jgi:NADH dehydrogenase (ubiquinone) 1 beta subcomplex subunit 7
MLISEEEMDAERLPIGYRDYCAHLLVPLNRCRQECFYLPWKCTHERHVYEGCQYEEYAPPLPLPSLSLASISG